MKNITLFVSIILTLFSLHSCAQNSDDIIGVWLVDNKHNKATYEIIELDNKFYGKVHKYSSESNSYIGNNKKEDYFLIDVEKKENVYTNGKMYVDKNELIDVKIILTNKNTLEISMSVEGYPYSETWKRKQ